jgi:hypothetical protein
MPQESNPVNDSLIPAQLIPAGTDEVFDRIAAGLYSLASMLVGEGENGAWLVEMAIANSEESVCHDPVKARTSSRQAMCAAALDILSLHDPGSLAAPEGLKPADTCIEEDDLAAAGVSGDELERMIAGPDRDRMRKWLASLPTALRTIFVLRAVAGFTSTEIIALLAAHGGPQAAGWTPAAVGELFRQGLCSLASQLIRASSPR